jgi:hypothetical protein
LKARSASFDLKSFSWRRSHAALAETLRFMDANFKAVEASTGALQQSLKVQPSATLQPETPFNLSRIIPASLI